MSPKMLMFFGFTFFGASLMCLIIEGSYYGSTDVSVLNALTGINFVEVNDIGLLTVPKMLGGFFTEGLPKLIMWDYSFLKGSYEIIKWILLYPLTIGFVWGIATLFIGAVQRTF